MSATSKLVEAKADAECCCEVLCGAELVRAGRELDQHRSVASMFQGER